MGWRSMGTDGTHLDLESPKWYELSLEEWGAVEGGGSRSVPCTWSLRPDSNPSGLQPASPPDVTKAEKILLLPFLFKKSEKAETPPEARKLCFLKCYLFCRCHGTSTKEKSDWFIYC